MRINTSGLYTTSFYQIFATNDQVPCLVQLGEIDLDEFSETLRDERDDNFYSDNNVTEYLHKLKQEIYTKDILFQPQIFDVEIALKCNLIPFDIGDTKNCLVYNSLEYDKESFYKLNLDLYQALADKSMDKQSHLARALSYGITDGHHSKFLTTENEFTKHFPKELLEEVYYILYKKRENN